MTPKDKALYTNSTLAIKPNTGDIKWFFQHIPGETIDMEVGFERILINEDNKKSLLTIGKDGILWKLNRKNGKFISLKETICLLYTSPSPRDGLLSRMPSSA